MKSKKMIITPTMANDFLRRNNANRPINKNTLMMYVTDMKNGHWKLTHQGIAFDESGNLVDGQHRLGAIVISGCAQEFWVFTGVPQAPVMDRGLQRSIKDCLRFAGVNDVTKQHVAVISCVKDSVKLSVVDAGEYLEKYRGSIDKALGYTSGRSRLKAAPISAAMFIAMENGIAEETIAYFAKVLADGVSTRPADETVIRLRDKLMTLSLSSQKIRSDALKLVERVIVAVDRGELLTKLYFPESHTFTIPN